MLRLYPEQLLVQLNQGLHEVYLLLGNDPFLLQESQNTIYQIAVTYGFKEHHNFQLDNSTDWQVVFSLCQEMSLFPERQVLKILLPQNGPNRVISEKLSILVSLLHNDLLLIIQGNHLTKTQENATWFNQLISSRSVLMVLCQTPKQADLSYWISTRAKQNQLQIDDNACRFLCYYYEGNLSALTQALEQLALLWPDKKITLSRVKCAVNDVAHFLPIHWIEALLEARIRRTLHILQRLRLEGKDPIVLLRTLQHELLLLLTIKRQSIYTPLRILFDKFNIWQNRRIKMRKALNRLSQDQLRQAVQIMTRTELKIKQDYGQSIWFELENLSLLLCHKSSLAEIFVDS